MIPASEQIAASRRALRQDLSFKRALANTRGTPLRWQAAIRFGQTSVSISTPMAGRNCRRKRATAPGVSHGSHTCTSPGCKSFSPSARPVAVPWVSSRRMPGNCARNSRSKMAAARVSPRDTA